MFIDENDYIITAAMTFDQMLLSGLSFMAFYQGVYGCTLLLLLLSGSFFMVFDHEVII